MKILHVLLQKKPKISPQTRPASCPFHRMRKRSSQQGPRSCGFCLPRISGFSLWRGVDSPRSICTDHMKQYPLLRRGKKIAYHPTPLLPGPDLPPGHRAVTVKFPTIEKEESTLTTEGLWLLQGPPGVQKDRPTWMLPHPASHSTSSLTCPCLHHGPASNTALSLFSSF